MRQDLFSLLGCGCGMASMPSFLGCAWRMDNAFLVRIAHRCMSWGGVEVEMGVGAVSPQAVTMIDFCVFVARNVRYRMSHFRQYVVTCITIGSIAPVL